MARSPAEERLGRLLAIVPWIAARDGPQVTEVCRRFAVEEEELLADLQLLFMCGVYPFTPDVLIDVDVADGRVWIRMADYFRRPLRLSPQEGLALVSAGSALLSVPGADPDGALATALGKLETLLGVGVDEGVDVTLPPVRAAVLASVRQGVDTGRKLELDYYSFGRDEHSTRVVHPWRVFNAAGQWYLSAWCERAEGERLFRVDRISRVEVLEEGFERLPDPGPGPPPVFSPAPDDPVVVLDLDPPAHWIADQYPNDGVEIRSEPGGQPGQVLRVRLRSGQRAWLERLLLRAGRSARLVEGDVTVLPAVASRLRSRYGQPSR